MSETESTTAIESDTGDKTAVQGSQEKQEAKKTIKEEKGLKEPLKPVYPKKISEEEINVAVNHVMEKCFDKFTQIREVR